MQYKKLVEVYESLSRTTKRLEKIDILSNFLRHLDNSDKDVLYLLVGRIYAEYDERKIGISEQIAIKALSKVTGLDSKSVIHEWKKLGDLGKVAEQIIKEKKQKTLNSLSCLTTEKVLNNLRKLPGLEGKGTVEKKISLITELLASASSIEAKYLVRTLIGDLIIGIQDSTIRDSLNKAFYDNSKESSKRIEEAIDKANDLALIFEIAKKGKIKSLEEVSIQVGKPLKVMLAQKVKNIEEGFKAIGKPCAIEYKYDGFRMLIHKKDNKIALFTRRLENVTKQFPEVVFYIEKYVKGSSFILDTEAVGFDSKTKHYTPFQNISQRIKRKYDIEKMQKNLPIEINVFDIIYYNGKSLLNEPFEKRSKLIKSIVKKHPYKITTSKQIITSSKEKAEEFNKKALHDNQEGIMMKNLHAIYQPGKRVGHMLKIKPEQRDLDLTIIGAEYGKGKRVGWLSSFILACKGNKQNEYLEIGKVSTGLKEKSAEEVGGVSFHVLTEMIKPLIIKEQGRQVEIKPKIVLSVTYQEIQHSPNYQSGFALRFPRFTALRPDKSIKNIATIEEVKKDYELQKRNYQYG